jgi:hypothetical protein
MRPATYRSCRRFRMPRIDARIVERRNNNFPHRLHEHPGVSTRDLQGQVVSVTGSASASGIGCERRGRISNRRQYRHQLNRHRGMPSTVRVLTGASAGQVYSPRTMRRDDTRVDEQVAAIARRIGPSIGAGLDKCIGVAVFLPITLVSRHCR